MEQLPTPAQTLAQLRKQPGVDLTKAKPGTRIIVETTAAVYQLEVVCPTNCIVNIQGTDPRFHQTVVGQFIQSLYDVAGKIAIPSWIGKTLRMQIKFKNGVLNCTPATSCVVEGTGFHYDVF